MAECLISQTKSKLFSQNKETIGTTKTERTHSVSKQNAQFSTFHIQSIYSDRATKFQNEIYGEKKNRTLIC